MKETWETIATAIKKLTVNNSSMSACVPTAEKVSLGQYLEVDGSTLTIDDGHTNMEEFLKIAVLPSNISTTQ